MKKHLMIATGLAVLSTSAFATKARMAALQQDTARGSDYVADGRNIFGNPADVNGINNFVVTEWGEASASDSDSAPHAEGGFFRKGSSLSYGLYLGSELGANNSVKNNGGTNTMLQTDNVAELFFAGDMGFQWGASISYSSNEDAPTGGVKKTNDTMGLSLGINSGDLGLSVNFALKDESKGGTSADDKYKADMGMNVGLTYNLNNMVFSVGYEKSSYEVTGTTATAADVENKAMSFGVGRVHNLSDTSMFFVDLRYETEEMTDKKALGTNSTKEKSTRLPLTLGFETEATSWLKLRGSVSQNVVIGDSEVTSITNGKTENSIANSTNVAAGATLVFGNLTIDGVIGTTADDRNATTAAKNGVLTTDNLMTRAAVTYKF